MSVRLLALKIISSALLLLCRKNALIPAAGKFFGQCVSLIIAHGICLVNPGVNANDTAIMISLPEETEPAVSA